MFFGTSTFKWLGGDNYTSIGFLKTTNLGLSDDDADVGVIQKGKFMDYAEGSVEEMMFGSGRALGMLQQAVSKDGTTDDAGFKNRTIGKLDLPTKRGAAVSIMVPRPMSEAEFEGDGEAIIDNLVATDGSGAIADDTPRGTQLSVLNGCLYEAQEGDFVIALLQDAGLEPETEGNLRIRVMFVAPYPLATPFQAEPST